MLKWLCVTKFFIMKRKTKKTLAKQSWVCLASPAFWFSSFLSGAQYLPGLLVLERGITCFSPQHADYNKCLSSFRFKINNGDVSSCLLWIGTSSCISTCKLSSEGLLGASLCSSSCLLNTVWCVWDGQARGVLSFRFALKISPGTCEKQHACVSGPAA